MLHVKGQQRKARRLWRHSLASALWSRQLAHMLARETGLCYLCGLLHNIGRVVTLGAVHEVARARRHEAWRPRLRSAHRDFFIARSARRVITAWALPPPVPAVIAQWESYAAAGALKWESNVINVAHKLADFTLLEPCHADAGMCSCRIMGYRDLGLARSKTPNRCSIPRPTSTPNWIAIFRRSALARRRPLDVPFPKPHGSTILSAMKNNTLGEPSARCCAAGGQSAAGGADLPVGEVFLRRYRTRRCAICAANERDFFIRVQSNPTLKQLQLLAGAAAGQGRLSADRIGCRHHRRQPAGAVQAGRSHSRLRRVLRADALHRAASAREVRRRLIPCCRSKICRASSGCCARSRRAW